MNDEKNNFENNENEDISENTGTNSAEEPENTGTESAEEPSETELFADSENTDENTDEASFAGDADNSSSIADIYDKQDTSDSKRKNIITASAAGAVIIVLVIIAVLYNMDVFETNKYNKMGYINISGKSLSDLADTAGIGLDEFKAQYELPEDMTGDTDEAAAFYNMPARKIAEMYGMDFEMIKESLQLPDTVNENTPWGEAEGEALLKYYVGEDSIDSFKEEYGFGDEVTGDTKWKDVRNTVDKAMLEDRKKQEKEAAKTTPQTNSDAANELSEEELQALIDQAMNSADGTASTSNDTADDTADDTASASNDTAPAPADN